jgi:hypothetical protein
MVLTPNVAAAPSSAFQRLPVHSASNNGAGANNCAPVRYFVVINWEATKWMRRVVPQSKPELDSAIA